MLSVCPITIVIWFKSSILFNLSRKYYIGNSSWYRSIYVWFVHDVLSVSYGIACYIVVGNQSIKRDIECCIIYVYVHLCYIIDRDIKVISCSIESSSIKLSSICHLEIVRLIGFKSRDVNCIIVQRYISSTVYLHSRCIKRLNTRLIQVSIDQL